MSTAGPNAPGTMADDNAVGAHSWSTPNNSKVSDNTYALLTPSSTGDSHYLKATNFGFAIPSGATINGVSVGVEQKRTAVAGNTVSEKTIKLVKGGVVSGTNKSTGAFLPGTEGTITYGGAADLWGLTLTDTDVNASTFGVVFQTAHNVLSGKAACNAYVDFISITIDYTTGGGGLSIPVAMQSYRRRRV